MVCIRSIGAGGTVKIGLVRWRLLVVLARTLAAAAVFYMVNYSAMVMQLPIYGNQQE